MQADGWQHRDESDDDAGCGDAFGAGAPDGWMTPRTPADLFCRDMMQETREEAAVWARIEAALERADHGALCRASAQRTWDAICERLRVTSSSCS